VYWKSMTLNQLFERNFYLYNEPADMRYLTHLRIRAAHSDAPAAQRSEYARVRDKLASVARAHAYRAEMRSECPSTPALGLAEATSAMGKGVARSRTL
jgi:hypothetical protein